MSLRQTIRIDASISSKCDAHYASLSTQNGVTLEFRDCFAQLIEDNVCQKELFTTVFPNPSNPEEIHQLDTFLQQLTSEMDIWVAKTYVGNKYTKKIRQTIPIVKELITNNPLGLFQHLRELIKLELKQFPNPLDVLSSMNRINAIKSDFSILTFRYRPGQHLTQFDNQISAVINDSSQIQTRLIDCIATWQLQQQHLAIGITPKNEVLINLLQLQPIAEELFNFLCHIYKELRKLEAEDMGMNFNICNYVQHLTNLLNQLIRKTFIVTEQPPWIVKKDKFKLYVKVCQLIGQSLFREADDDPKVKLSMIIEAQAKELHNQGSTVLSQLENASWCTIEEKDDELASFEDDQSSKLIIARYNPVVLKNVDRPSKQRDGKIHVVMEEKFCFIFTATFKFLGNSFQIWTTSLPVTVSTHPYQNPFGVGIVVWDYATNRLNRVPFEVSQYLPWASVAFILSAVFRHILELKSEDPGLNDGHLNFLREKAFSSLKPEESHVFTTYNQMSFAELARPKFVLMLPSADQKAKAPKGFSFWEWFYSTIKILQVEQNKKMWVKNLIAGYIARLAAESYLSNQPEGTFLIRFPDSVKAAISVTYVHKDSGHPLVESLQPYTLSLINIQPLADLIKTDKRFKYIYPFGLCKNLKFQDFYSRKIQISGYKSLSDESVSNFKVGSSTAGCSSQVAGSKLTCETSQECRICHPIVEGLVHPSLNFVSTDPIQGAFNYGSTSNVQQISGWTTPANSYQVPFNSPSDFPWSPSSTQTLPEYNSQPEEAQQRQLQLPSIDFIRNQTLPDHQQLLYSNGNFAYQYNPEPHGGSFAQMETDIGNNSFNASDDLIAQEVQNVMMNSLPL